MQNKFLHWRSSRQDFPPLPPLNAKAQSHKFHQQVPLLSFFGNNTNWNPVFLPHLRSAEFLYFLISPSSPSSPIHNISPVSAIGILIPILPEVQLVTGRSNEDPFLRKFAGDKFTTILLAGSKYPVCRIAERTLSLAPLTPMTDTLPYEIPEAHCWHLLLQQTLP